MSVAALPIAPTLPRRRSAVIDFMRQQPLGAISFVIIVVMMPFELGRSRSTQTSSAGVPMTG